ncbi:MAG: substrate-binding domain-containing protein [Tenuifilaceae bacterium]|nr:substrate-binding domain-containing protein [Tenuifilaceae bacterium]
MNAKFSTVMTLLFFVLAVFISCEKVNTDSPYIDGLSIENYPTIDGSTSTLPLNRVIACELLGLNYQWQENKGSSSGSTWSIEPKIKGRIKQKFDKLILSSQTHNSFINLIDNKVDMAFAARSMSPDEKEYATSKGVNIIETSIALDAFIFIVNPTNPVEDLTTENIQDIYTGKKTNWTDFGIEIFPNNPEYSDIHPFVRNPNSGSQELMDLLIMKDLEYIDLPIYKENLIFTMAGMLDAIGRNPLAIGYTVYYYNNFIIRPHTDYLKTIAIDGVKPTEQTISNQLYPYTIEVYAVIRSDTDKTSMTYKIYEWLQTTVGKQSISNSGYIPN